MHITIIVYEVSQGAASFTSSFLLFQCKILIHFFRKITKVILFPFYIGLSRYGLVPLFSYPKEVANFLKENLSLIYREIGW